MTSWRRSSNSNFAAIPSNHRSQTCYMRPANKPALADTIWVLMPKDIVEPTGQRQSVLDDGSLVH